MTSPEPQIVWEQTDRLLSGSSIAVRAVGLPEDGQLRAAVAFTVYAPAGSVQIADDGSATVTLLVGPAEALGVSAWLRQAAVAAEEIGPPLYSWDPPAG